MTLLTIGVLLWIAVHLMPALARPLRQSLINRFGVNAYRGLFSLALVVALVLIVFGWRSTPENFLYVLPVGIKTVAFVLLCVSFLLIGSTLHPTSIKRYIRHPMLTGVVIWAASHLLTNGTTRALILFGGIGLWALLEIPLISKRDGAYEKPAAVGFSEELKGLFFSGAFLLLALLLHPYFAGVTPFPR